METGVEIVDVLPVEETKSLNVPEERVEDRVVFEDAVNAEEHLLEQSMKSDSANSVDHEAVKEETAGDSEAGVVLESPNFFNGVDKFEAVIEALILGGENKEDAHNEEEPTLITTKGKDVDDGSSVLEPTVTSKADKEGPQKDERSKLNESQNGLGSSEDWGKEFSEADVRNENESLDDVYRIKDVKSGVGTEEPATMDETINSMNTGIKREVGLCIHQVIESNSEIIDQNDNVNDVCNNKATLERCETSTGELINGKSGHHVELLDSKNAKVSVDYNLTDIDAKFPDEEIEEHGDPIASSGSRYESEDLSYDFSVKDINSVSVMIDSGNNGHASDLIVNLEHNGETFPEKNSSVDLHRSLNDWEDEVQNGTLSPVKVKDGRIPKIKDDNSGLTTMDNQLDKCQQLDAIGNEKVEKAVGKVQEENKGTCPNTDAGIQPSPNLPSSTEKVPNLAPSPAPAGLGRAAPLLEPAPRTAQQPRVNGTVLHMQTQKIEDSSNGEAAANDETRERLQMIRVKFLRLAYRLGQTPHNVVVAQVLYRLGLAEQLRGRNGGRVGAFSFDRASAMAEQLEAAGQEPLDFSCTIMVLGKTGVGKSATINSIFDEVKFSTDAFQIGTKKVQDVVGTVQGIKVRVIDTPGLLPSWSDQCQNEKILLSVKRFIKETPPDIVLYLDRLDVQNRDSSDMPFLRTITEIFGPSIWFNAIVVFTHAASAPPDGPNGTASSYDMFVTQCSHVVQQAIRQAAGDMRLMNPVSLVENHSECRTNRAGQRVLPNGQVWKPHLLLLSFASKILAEANALLKLQDSPPGRPFMARSRAPPLPILLSSLLQSRPLVKLPEEQFVDGDDLEDEMEGSSDSEDESEYEELPPFKPLTKAQVAKLSKTQKKAYFDELEYREKLFVKKQLKEEKIRRRMMKKMAAQIKDLPTDYAENVEEEGNGAASVPVPMPDVALPASFDSDNPTHRYRYLDSSNQWLIRPVLETHGWDHDVGYEGINIEKLFVYKEKIPLSFSGQVTKDKKDANVQMEMTSSIKHGEGKATSFGFDMQTVGKDMAYTLRGERIFCNFWKNKAIAAISATLLGNTLSAGVKVENKLVASKRFRLVVTGGGMASREDVAYGGSLEAQLRDREYPLGRSLSTLGLSVMDWHGDLAIGCTIQSQIPVGRSTILIGRANLNNKGAGQVSIRLNSSEQLQIALIGLVPLVKKILGYPQQ